MDDEYVAVRPVRYPFADTLPEQAQEDVRLARADDDQIRPALLGKLDDRFCRIAHGRNKLALQAVFLSLPKPRSVAHLGRYCRLGYKALTPPLHRSRHPLGRRRSGYGSR